MNQRTPNSFAQTDKFGLYEFSKALERFIATESYFIEAGAVVVSLNGAFGSGKTTFLEMWREDLRERRRSGETLPIPVILNAWESDYCGDPLLSMLSAILSVLGEGRDVRDKERAEKIRAAVKDVANFSIGLAGSFAKISGFDPIAAAKYAEDKKRNGNSPKYADLLSIFEARVAALQHLKEVLAEAFGGTSLNALIMVDELDRCRPTYAIEYLETIKHVFDIRGIAFVLAVDKAQLESSAKALFGSGLDFQEYYRKFAHRNVMLPHPSEEGVSELAKHYTHTILELSSADFHRVSLLDEKNAVRVATELARTFGMNPRQIRESYRLLGHLVAGSEKGGKLCWCFGAASVLLSFLAVARPSLYRRIGSGSWNEEAYEELFSLFREDRKRQWWAAVIFTGYEFRDSNSYDFILAKFIQFNALPEEWRDPSARQALYQYVSGWNDAEGGFQRIFRDLEALQSFGRR